jgi:predicted PurR-regulated permease PerM
MDLRRQMTFWVAAFVVFVAALWLLHDILLPFVAGMAIAYLLDPVAKRLQRLGLGRIVATLLIVVLFVLVFVVLILLIVPLLGGQLWALIGKLPEYVTRLQGFMADPSRPWLQKIVGEGMADANSSVGNLVTQGASWITAFLKSLWSGGQALVSIFSLVVVTPVVAFYLLYDWDRMIAVVDGWVPVHHRETVRALAREIDVALSGFVRGQAAVCLILGVYYTIGLTLTGVNFGLLIGMASGLLTFIPYVGSMTGLVIGVSVAAAQFWPNATPILVVAGVFLVGQFLEGYVLSPRLVGRSIGLHPVWLIFALFAFGYLFGFVGLLIAVPLSAALGVLARFALRQYLASPFYIGVPGPGPDKIAPPGAKGR